MALAELIIDKLTTPTSVRVSAITVLFLAIFATATWYLPGSQWTFGPVVGLAAILLAFGWPALTGVRIRPATQICIAVSGMVIPFSVSRAHDLWIATAALGLAMVAVIVSTIMTASAPESHNIYPGPDGQEGPTVDYQPDNRLWASTSLTSSLASSVTALLIVAGGATWLALDAMERWSVTVPMACFVVAVVVWGDQIGRTFRAQSVSALISAVVAGLVAAVVAWKIGSSAMLLPVVLPGLARSVGELAAIIVLGICTGVAVALAIIVVDGLLGDHENRQSPIGALSRGAAKFLVAAVPVYAMIRIGGI
ncbi:hypothetical protein [Schaalia vaccimaxillae]|uniref:hypothetical protein n=1 Tax=Schaalia vaccimaxillae TaxID=183916 RepID=UPI000415FD29|nr:hypothetical protein [Schaalia vaccimaxillae]